MASLQKAVIDKFLTNLEASDEYDQLKVDKIKALLDANKRIKADDLVKIFSFPFDGEVE